MNVDQWLDRQRENRNTAEVRTLGTILSWPNLADQLIATVEPQLFRRHAHRLIADAIWSLRAEGKTVDLETVQDRLIGQGHIDAVGGPVGLWDCYRAGEEPTVRWADDLVELERRRQVWQACRDGSVQVTNPDVEPDDVAADVAAALHTRERFETAGLMSTDDLLNLEAPQWLVDGVFPAGVSMLFGSPKSGKSYVALQTAWSYATGTSWFRRACGGPGQVLYLAGEGVADLKLRAEALVKAHGVSPGEAIRWWTDPLSLSKPRDAAKLRLTVEQTGATLVVVDTWRRFSGLVDENDAGAASQAVGALEDLARAGTSVLIVHHTNAEGGIRGSTAVAGAVESAVRSVINDQGRVFLTPYLTRRGTGFRDIELGFSPAASDSVLREVGGW